MTNTTPAGMTTDKAFVLLRYIVIAATLYFMVVEGDFVMAAENPADDASAAIAR